MNCFIQYCRLCTSNNNVSLTLLNLDSDGKRFIDKLEAVVPETVDYRIQLPNGICTICAVHLNEAYKFIKQCIDSQIILKQHLNEKLCRLCAGDDSITFTLTTMDSDNVLLSYKLETIAPEILKCNEKLSDCICSICSIRLNETYKFIEKYFKSQEILMRYAQQQLQNNKVMKNESEIKEENIDKEYIKLDLETDINFKVEENLESQNNRNFEAVFIKEETHDEEYIEVDLEKDTSIKIEESLELKNNADLHSNIIIKRNSNTQNIFSSEENDKNERPYRCEICSETFNENGHLNLHIRSHTNEETYKCKICEKVFTQSRGLTRHVRTHSNVRPYKCEICEKGFIRNGDLTRHFRIHTKEKPFKCEICEKNFTDRANLGQHIRSHTKEKPFKCKLCGKTFTQNGHLKEHTRTHTKEKPYKCKMCKKSFSKSQNLKVHIRTHTKEKPYKCEMCEKAFTQSGHLKEHIRSHTKENLTNVK